MSFFLLLFFVNDGISRQACKHNWQFGYVSLREWIGKKAAQGGRLFMGSVQCSLDKMIQPENKTSASLRWLLTGLPPQESSWAFAKHVWWQLLTASNHHPTTSCPAARGPSCLTPFCLAKLRNMEQLWIIVFKWYVLLETAHWLKHTLWTFTLSGVRKVLKGSWRNQYLK